MVLDANSKVQALNLTPQPSSQVQNPLMCKPGESKEGGTKEGSQEARNGGVQEWRNAGVEECRSGGMQEWRNGGVEGWRNGGMEE